MNYTFSFFLIANKLIYNLNSLWFYVFVEQPVVFCFFLLFYPCHSPFLWPVGLIISCFSSCKGTECTKSAQCVMTLLKAGGLGENSMIAKQSQTLMGFAQKYYIQGSFNLITTKVTFSVVFISAQGTSVVSQGFVYFLE